MRRAMGMAVALLLTTVPAFCPGATNAVGQPAATDSRPLAAAPDTVKLELYRGDSERWRISLFFRNTAKAPVELEIPVEGAGDCDRYFDIDALKKDGSVARKQFLYAPHIIPYVVRLRPAGLYVHFIKPGAYLNAVELDSLQALRVKYTDPTAKTSIVSDWLVLVDLWGDTNSKEFHLPTCQQARDIRPENLAKFQSTRRAQEEGYSPCKACLPPAG